MPKPGLLIRPETTALVVIDLQEKLIPAIDGREEVLANTEKLLRLAEVTGLTTFLTTQYSKGLGATLSSNRGTLRSRTHRQDLLRLPGGRPVSASP